MKSVEMDFTYSLPEKKKDSTESSIYDMICLQITQDLLKNYFFFNYSNKYLKFSKSGLV